MVFFKYLSDRHDRELGIYSRFEDISFIIPPECGFSDVYNQRLSDKIGEIINTTLSKIENENSSLRGIFSVDFTSQAILGPAKQRTKLIKELISSLNKIDLSNADNVLSDAFLRLIQMFRSDYSRKKEDAPPPLEIRYLPIRIAKLFPGCRIYDPSCRNGGMLLAVAKEAERNGLSDFALYGQEKSKLRYSLTRMNMILNGRKADIACGDVLTNPLFVEDGKLTQFDVVLTLLPVMLSKWKDGYDAEHDKYKRFSRGIPPNSKGDYAFILHAIESAKPQSGKVVLFVPQGVLVRGSVEGQIRSRLVKENLLDAVISLPHNLFPRNRAPMALLIFDRSREKGGANEDRQEVMFMDATKEFVVGKENNMLSEENIEKICATYFARKNVAQLVRLASLEEIAENDFNLNVTRYLGIDRQGATEFDVVAAQERLLGMGDGLWKLGLEVRRCMAELV